MLFGTDGIRGEVAISPVNDEVAIADLLEKRLISPRLMRLIGEALAKTIVRDSQIIIGWDERPANPELVASLTIGLHLGGCRVVHGGICATPA